MNKCEFPIEVGASLELLYYIRITPEINLQTIRHLLEAGANPKIIDHNGCNLLDYVVQNGNLDCLRLLLSAGAKIRLSNIKHAIKCNFVDGLETLLNHVSCPNLNDVGRNLAEIAPLSWNEIEDATPLHVALIHGRVECFRLLLKFGVDPLIHRRGDTILHSASRNCESLREVLNLRICLINIQNFIGETPLYIATKYKKIECIDLLMLSGANPNFGKSPLFEAISNNNVECIEHLILGPPQIDSDIIRTDIIRTDIIRADINISDEVDGSALFVAIRCVKSAEEGALRTLLRFGIDLRVRCSIRVPGISEQIDRCTALSYAVLQRNNVALTEILTSGRDIDFLVTATDNLNMTPLHHACSASNWRAVQLLIQHNAVLDSQDQSQKTPLHYASMKSNRGCIEMLLEAIKLTSNSYSIINAKDRAGWTPLHRACRNKSLDCIMLLIQYGADIQLLTNEGRSPSQIARNRKHHNIADYLDGLENEIVTIKEPDNN